MLNHLKPTHYRHIYVCDYYIWKYMLQNIHPFPAIACQPHVKTSRLQHKPKHFTDGSGIIYRKDFSTHNISPFISINSPNPRT